LLLMKTGRDLFPFCLLLAFLFAGCSSPAVVQVRVVDTDNRPVANAKVTVGESFNRLGDILTLNVTASPESKTVATATTDAKGEYKSLHLLKGSFGISATKEGYYGSYESDLKRGDLPLTITLRQKHNPIPMYAKGAWFNLPSREGDFGYDLFAGDLVAPYGVGTNADFIFRVSTTNYVSGSRQFSRLKMDVIFSNANDGIQILFIPDRLNSTSDYLLPFTAPEAGYTNSLAAANGDTQSWFKTQQGRGVDQHSPILWYWKDSYRQWYGSQLFDEVNYFFKVRSDSNGKACYGIIRGKIDGVLVGIHDDEANIRFTYFVNPDGTRNIEYDPHLNLMKRFNKTPPMGEMAP
jgi:hypothetical protein